MGDNDEGIGRLSRGTTPRMEGMPVGFEALYVSSRLSSRNSP